MLEPKILIVQTQTDVEVRSSLELGHDSNRSFVDPATGARIARFLVSRDSGWKS